MCVDFLRLTPETCHQPCSPTHAHQVRFWLKYSRHHLAHGVHTHQCKADTEGHTKQRGMATPSTYSTPSPLHHHITLYAPPHLGAPTALHPTPPAPRHRQTLSIQHHGASLHLYPTITAPHHFTTTTTTYHPATPPPMTSCLAAYQPTIPPALPYHRVTSLPWPYPTRLPACQPILSTFISLHHPPPNTTLNTPLNP